MKLTHHHYGKAKVRVMKVTRAGAQHSLKELEVSVMLRGDFDASYTRADNRLVVPTDTMKNTVYVLAREKLGAETEDFGLALGEHFLKTYPQVEQADIGLSERGWERMAVGAQPHPHAFVQKNTARTFAQVACARSGSSVESGIEDLLILKTTGSGFEGYAQDKFTTLPATKDRIMATKLKATWAYEKRPAKYSADQRRHPRSDARGLCRQLQPVRAGDFVPDGRGGVGGGPGNLESVFGDAEQALPAGQSRSLRTGQPE